MERNEMIYCKICKSAGNLKVPVNDFHLLFWHGIKK